MFCSGFPPFILTAIIEAYTCKYPNWPLKALVETIKVHMKRFLTVVFCFIIVKINIKKSYIR